MPHFPHMLIYYWEIFNHQLKLFFVFLYATDTFQVKIYEKVLTLNISQLSCIRCLVKHQWNAPFPSHTHFR